MSLPRDKRQTEEQAAAFAKRLLREAGDDPGTVAARAWRYAYGRSISDEERAMAVEFIRVRQEAGGVRERPVEELCLALFNTNEFIYQQ